MRLPTPQNKLGKYIIDFCSKHGFTIAMFIEECRLPNGKCVPHSMIYESLRTGEIKHTKHFFAIAHCIADYNKLPISFTMNRLRLILEGSDHRKELDV